MSEKRFPQYLSAPYQVLWFEADDLLLIMMFFVFTMVFSGWLFPLVVIGPWLYARAKRKYPRGFLKHWLYFMGLVSMPGYPNYFQKEFFE